MLALLLVLLLATPAAASTIITFPGGGGGGTSTPCVEGRSGDCRYEEGAFVATAIPEPPPVSPGSASSPVPHFHGAFTIFGTDSNGVHFTFGDGPFDLLSFDVIAIGAGNVAVISSKGAVEPFLTGEENLGTRVLVGDGWRGITSFDFTYLGIPPRGSGSPTTIGNIVLQVSVPAPAVWWLVGVGAGVGVLRRWRAR